MVDSAVVAVPLSSAVLRVDGQYAPVAADAIPFRRHFGLRDDAEVLVLGASKDHVIERYWEHRIAARTPDALARLRLAGVTSPNFSFFTDAPRPHTLWNRARIHLNLEELSDAGVRVIPHMNAITESDWRFWTHLLKAAPSIVAVAKEFQTGSGNAQWDAGCASLTRMRRLQEEVGRSLHPVLIGGGKFVEEAAMAFPTFSLVDATPHMKAIKRQVAYRVSDSTVAWRGMHFPKGEPIDGLMEHNIALYSRVIEARVQGARGVPASVVRAQLSLPLPDDRTGAVGQRT